MPAASLADTYASKGLYGLADHNSARVKSLQVTIAEIVADEVLDSAYAWLSERRKDWPPNADVWTFNGHRRRPDCAPNSWTALIA